MQIFKEKEALKSMLTKFRNEGLSIGFVPTMGALHQGHISLIAQARSDCDKVVVSIFVNPTQFDNPVDLQKYPRTLDNDLLLLSEQDNDLLVFTPNPQEIYGETVISDQFSFDGLEEKMEGRFRRGHFNGVGTVVSRLFEIVQPDKAFFGEKDFQQLQIIRNLVKTKALPIEIVGCPIDREPNGLARSSRNERLEPAQRLKAGFIFDLLKEVKIRFGTKSASEISQWVERQFDEQPDFKLEYFEIADVENLEPVQGKLNGRQYRAFIAVHAGDIRLIDNIALN